MHTCAWLSEQPTHKGQMLYNSIEQELWRIFTFYALHADASQPEALRPAIFLRFTKDCQIVSRRLPPMTVELEVTRLLRSKDVADTANATINFSDFLQLLDILAIKIYPKDNAEIAVKRLLLENVLLLANRRVPSTELYDLSHVEANKVVRETFGKHLAKIFDYYLDRADKRRNAAVAAEKMHQKELRAVTNQDVTQLSQSKSHSLQQLKDLVKSQKDVISYKEYMQFCYDFNLKSTSLLTAVQVGEVFLNLVPLNRDAKCESGMTFDLFLKALVYMAFVAFRDAPRSVASEDCVRALLLYMWKAVNDSDKTQRLVRSNRSHTLTQFAGSLNLFGSGQFSDAFLAHWMRDQFIDYASPRVDKSLVVGSTVVKSVVKHDDGQPQAAAAGAANAAELLASNELDDHAVLESLQKNLVLESKPTAARHPRRTNSIYIKSFSHTAKSRAATSDHTQGLYSNLSSSNASGPVSLLDGHKLSILLQDRPELSEYLFMEIQSLKVQT